ncbi:amidohydrolase family protein [Dactylosporangium aurantiacum]|uniref:amidohydrolase family protein n=1 Tax=Dactylosporangium aurantiacum TaxID=35754 RepID=UPI000694D30A|nr:amidohydrolase family protein [Dactylosporangium aurantiacum]MDG6105104.1 amidohydrolase family protein [Dactylosporangium aurantiacum]
MPSTYLSDRPRLVAIRAGALFDGVSTTLVHDPVLVLDGPTIVRVDQPTVPEGAQVVDLPGTTLLPGLIDTHVHLAFDAGPDPVAALAARDDTAALAAMTTAGRTALRAGITTVRDLGDRDYLSLRLRGAPDLPTIVTAGPPVTTPAGHCHFLGGATGPTPEALRAAVRERADRGVDIIKVMASGGTMTPGTRQEIAQFTREQLTVVVDEAHRLGLPVTAHAHGTSAIRAALDAGVDGMEHVSFWSADGVDDPGDLLGRMVDSRVVVGITAGVAPAPGAVPPPVVAMRMPRIIANTRAMHEAGARMIIGTDAGIGPVKPHDVLRHALAQTSRIGLDAATALRLATSTAAEACGLGHRKGRLAPGFDADIVAVQGNPLLDLAALQHVRAVFARGVTVAST